MVLEQEIGGKMKDTIKAALITGVLGVVASTVTGIFTYKAGAETVERRIDNQISQVVEVDNGDVDAAVEYLVSRVEDLEDENESLEGENETYREKIELRQIEYEETSETNELSASENLMTVCPPYEVKTPVLFNDKDSFKMGGETYNNGFTYGAPGPAEEYFILFNLDGKYSSINFDFGHVDGSGVNDCTLMVYLDGEYVATLEKKSDELVTNETIELKGAKQMKMCFDTGGAGNFADYGLANIKVTK